MKYLLLLPLFLLGFCVRTTAQGVCDINEDTPLSKFPLGSLGAKAFPQIHTSMVKVLEVTPGGPAALAGLQAGDFIYGANGERLPVTGFVHEDAWKGTVSELGYAIERSESTNGVLTLQVLRSRVGALSLSARLPAAAAWRPSSPAGDPRLHAFFEKICSDLHTKVQAADFFPAITNDSIGNVIYYDAPFFGILLLASPNWNDTAGARPYRLSINKIRTNAIAFLNTRPVVPMLPAPNYVNTGLDNWHLAVSAMFLAEYRRKTGDSAVDAELQRAAMMMANRIQETNGGVMMHGGIDPANGYNGGGLNIINAHANIALGMLRGAGVGFSAADATGATIHSNFLASWGRLKTSVFMLPGNEQGTISYAGSTPPASAGRPGCPAGWETNARTPASAVGFELYRRAGGTSATPDDLDKLSVMKAYTLRNWQRQQNCHAYSLGTVFAQMLLSFVSDREQRYFRENSRFLLTMTRDHAGEVLYFPGRANVGGDDYLGLDNIRYLMPGFAWAIASGNLPSFPPSAPEPVYVRLKSHRSDWPQLAARRVKVVGLTQNVEAELINPGGTVLSPAGYSFEWFQPGITGPAVAFTSRNALATPVTFPAAGTYRIGFSAHGGGGGSTEWFDFEVVTSNPPVDTSAAITRHPVSRFALPGGSVTFHLAVSGTGPFVYQWKRNGVNFGEPQTTPNLDLANLSPNIAGAFQCSISHPGGVMESAEAVLSFPGIWNVVSGGLKREVWNNLSGALPVSTLTGDPRYPLCPDSTGSVTSAESPRDVGQNYGQRLSGWLVPPVTGEYRFYIASDDSSEFWLSTDETSAARKLTERTSVSGYRVYSDSASQPVMLTAGRRYYIEILHVEGNGGDHVSVAWQKPGDPPPADGSPPIPGTALEYVSLTPDLSDGLVSHWNFNETAGSTALDTAPTANDGTVIDATIAAGRIGNGRLFDGTDQIQCGNAGALCGLQPFTVAAWIRVNNGNSTDGVIIQQRDSNGINGQYMLNVDSTGRLRFWCYGDSTNQFDFTGSTRINDGQWHHVAAARNTTGGAFIYVDGVLDASVSGTTVRNLDGGINIGIGADIRDNNKHFRGTIDEVRIYNRALTAAQATAVMNLTPQAGGYQQSFTGLPNGATTFPDGSVLTTDAAGAARVNSNGQSSFLIMTAAETLWTRTQYVLPQLRPGHYGFSASFRYGVVKPASGPWADGFGFYLKPATEPVDTVANQVGGYAKGLGVEFITFSNPRHQIRVNNTVLPATYPVTPNVNAQWVDVRLEYIKPPGVPGRLTFWQNGVPVLHDVPVDYTPGPSDVFAFTARTGGYAQTTLLDDISITPLTFKPASNLSARHLSSSGNLTFTEVKWDSDPGGTYDLFVSTDLQNWSLSQSYTAAGLTTEITSIGSTVVHPRYFFRVARRQ